MTSTSPSKAIVPDVGSSTPAMMLNRVLFPQPLGPMIETNSPFATVRSIVASVSRLWRPEPNVFVTFCTSNFGVSKLCSLFEHVKGRNLVVEGYGLNRLCFWLALPLPSAGIIQIRFIGSVYRPLRLPLSRMAPLAARSCCYVVG